MNRRRIFIYLLTVLVVLIFWNSYRSTTFELVTVQKISENEMTVINLSNRVRTITIPIDISKLVEENKEYTISYDKRIFDKHRLRTISP
ncbi:hypothetical protein J2T12_003749 [Paenibacillus anaericanus]|uniref:hypothetical protein n=1 Tax=Paenibacillus anaericanus TaxID=170367 RepID=UPI002786331E|nr:hypothetical protein [Paenibacillus anaericanus]MDQ0090335.1 hypothetical protein [Paenibacillus anaericanus]